MIRYISPNIALRGVNDSAILPGTINLLANKNKRWCVIYLRLAWRNGAAYTDCGMRLIKFLSGKNDHKNNDNALKLTWKWAKKSPADLHGRCPPGCVIGNSKRVRGIPLMPAIITIELSISSRDKHKQSITLLAPPYSSYLIFYWIVLIN